MSYKTNRAALGYQKWGVTNPWVFADLSQPQRQRGSVSPLVFQTAGSYLKSAHLGETEDEELKRARRMEMVAFVGLSISLASLYLLWNRTRVKKNSRRRRRMRSRR